MQRLYTTLALFMCVGAITALFLSGDDIHPRGLVEDTVNSTVEDARPNIANPLDIEGVFPLSFNDTLLSGNLTLTDPAVYGLNGILIPYLYHVMVGSMLNFVLVFPELQVQNLLTTDITIFGLPMWGNGTATLTVNELQLKGVASVNINGPTMKDLSLEINLASIALEVHGFLGDENISAFASSLLTLLGNDFIVTYLNDNSAEIGKTVSPIIEQVISDLLNGNSTDTNSQLKGMVTNLGRIWTEKIKEEEINK